MAAHVGYIPVPYAHLDPYNVQYTVNTTVCSFQNVRSRKLTHNLDRSAFFSISHALT